MGREVVDKRKRNPDETPVNDGDEDGDVDEDGHQHPLDLVSPGKS